MREDGTETERSPGEAREDHPRELHGHEHRHAQEGPHRHPHHHGRETQKGHEHAHTLRFERFTYLISPIHQMDPRFKLIASMILVLGVVAGPALRAAEFALLVMLVVSVTVLGRVPLTWSLGRSLLVLPIAFGIAVFAPLGKAETISLSAIGSAYAQNWLLIWAILTKAWFSAYIMLLLSSTTPMPNLLKALRELRVPSIFVTMLTFLYRFTDVFVEQLIAMQSAIKSRAPGVRGWRLVRLYGNLTGSLFIRAYERGERIYSAMLSRGYNGVLPTSDSLASRPSDWIAPATAIIVVAAVLLY